MSDEHPHTFDSRTKSVKSSSIPHSLPYFFHIVLFFSLSFVRRMVFSSDQIYFSFFFVFSELNSVLLIYLIRYTSEAKKQ